MEAELNVDGATCPASRRTRTARPRSPSARAPATAASARQPRPVPHGLRGRARGQGGEQDLRAHNVDQAIGEGNYGRLGPGQQQRYTHAQAETQFAQPATGGTPDEQPGAMPEIFASPRPGRTRTSTAAGRAGRCSCRPGATTGPRGRPSTSSSASGPTSGAAGSRWCRRCRTARRASRAATSGSAAAGGRARRAAGAATDGARHERGRRGPLRIGHTLPRGADVARSRSTGGAWRPDARVTNRGLEVSVAVARRPPHAGGDGGGLRAGGWGGGARRARRPLRGRERRPPRTSRHAVRGEGPSCRRHWDVDPAIVGVNVNIAAICASGHRTGRTLPLGPRALSEPAFDLAAGRRSAGEAAARDLRCSASNSASGLMTSPRCSSECRRP